MAYTDIDDPTAYFQIKLFVGNQTARSITFDGNTDMQPDLVWIKPRDNGAWSHNLTDSVRGAGKGLFSDLDNATYDYGTGTDGSVRTFDSNGFSIGTATQVNNSSSNIVAWNWKAGGSASSNTDGSITSTVSANTTSGFSIVSYTGAGGSSNVGHGLGVAPNLIIAKNRESSLSWFVSCDAIGWTKRLKLNGTNNAASNVAFGDTNPDSTKFYLQDNNLNTSGETHIAYCFAEKKGYSKFGSYVGNGNADGTFVHTGFKPSFVLCKNTGNSGAQWLIVDNKRVGINPIQHYLQSNSSSAEGSDTANFDFLSNGFKCRSTNSWSNQSGYNIIYMAFAENPFVTSTGVPATAR